MFHLFKKDPRDKVVKFIQKNFTKQVSEILVDNLKTCFALDPDASIVKKLGITKQGGFPDLPPNFAWPTANGKPLDFILQLNLADFASEEVGLPKDGILYFFLDLSEEEFPNNKDQYKVIYAPEATGLKSVEYKPFNEATEKTLKINDGLTFPADQSYLLKDVDLNDDEFEAIINLDYPLISELYGGGIFDIGALADADVINEWVEAYNLSTGKNLVSEDSTNAFVGILSFMLDEWNFPDTWVHFGMEKEALKNKSFDEVLISFTFT